MRHATEGKNCLPYLLSTTPSCLGAIKGTPRRMEGNTKQPLSILDHPHSVFAHPFVILSDSSSVLVRNCETVFELDSWPCVCAFRCGFVCVASLPYSVLLCDHILVRARDSNLWRFLANGIKKRKQNTVVFKWVFGPLERG